MQSATFDRRGVRAGQGKMWEGTWARLGSLGRQQEGRDNKAAERITRGARTAKTHTAVSE